LGIAFQIIDDVLDYVGTEESIGKPAGNDLRQGLVTLPPPNALLQQAATAQAGYLVILNARPDPYAEITLPDAPSLEQLREVKDVSLRRLRNVSENDRGRIVEVLGARWSLRKILRCGILSARMYAEPLAAAVAQ
jgi:geranylgeranyl pyrophosphate synthase